MVVYAMENVHCISISYISKFLYDLHLFMFVVLTCRYMENGIVTKTSTFLPALPFTTGDDAGSLELFGDRVTNLGTNL